MYKNNFRFGLLKQKVFMGYQKRRNKFLGFTLLEILLVLGGIAVLGTGALVTYKVVQGRESTTTAVENSRYMARSLMQTYGQAGSFEGLDSATLINGKLTPKNMAVKGATINNTWGGTVQVAPVGAANNAFALTWNKVPSGSCANMAVQLASDFSKIEVNGTTVKDENTPIDPNQAANLCGGTNNNTLALTSADVAIPQSGEPPDPKDNGGVKLAVFVPTPAAPVIPPGMTFSSFTNLTPPPPPTPVAPSVVSVTAAGMSVPQTVYTGNGTPPGATQYDPCSNRLSSAAWQPNPQSATQDVPRSAACPSGYSGTDTWTQQQTHSRSAFCAVPAAQSDPFWGAWSAWSDTGGKMGESNTCTATCATQLASAPWQPNPGSKTQNVAGSAACPAGMSGSDTWTQQQTSTRTASCAIPSGTAPPTWTAWSAWVNTGGKIAENNTCASTCATQLASAAWKPNPQTANRNIAGSAACAAGYVGSDTWQQGQVQSRTATCAVPSSTAAPTWGAWSAWANTGGKIGESNTCTANCSTQLASAAWKPNPQVATQTIAASAACPAGYSGSDTWSQNQTRSRTASCANGASAAAPVWGAYSAWVNSGGKIGEVNTCKLACPAAPTYTAVSLSIGQNPGATSTTTGLFSWVFTGPGQTGVTTGSGTIKITYNGASATTTTSCSATRAANGACTGNTTVSVGGAVFTMFNNASAPLKLDQASGNWAANMNAYMSTPKSGCPLN